MFGKAFINRLLQPDIAEAKRIKIFADGIETGGTQPHHLFVGKAGSQYHAPHRRIIPIIPFQIVRVPADKVSQPLRSFIKQRPRRTYWPKPFDAGRGQKAWKRFYSVEHIRHPQPDRPTKLRRTAYGEPPNTQ